MSKEVTVFLLSKVSNCSQVFVGLKELEHLGMVKLLIIDYTNSNHYPYKDKAIILVKFNSDFYFFDLQDGYWYGMEYYLERCDFYYKRSFSTQKNLMYNKTNRQKIRPLGFNMFVSCKDNPYAYESFFRTLIKTVAGVSKLSSFTIDSFVQNPAKKNKNDVKIIFFTRLYDFKRGSHSNENDKEIECINNMRIDLLRGLSSQFGSMFLGGLQDNKEARFQAPDLIVSKKITEKGNYIKQLHSCDIGVGSMGLHESTGWKTAEYIAASMGIVHEKLHYTVPGDFQIEKNYFDFTSVEECIERIQLLIDNPDLLFQMRVNNQKYYRKYLSPEKLVWNALTHHGKEDISGESFSVE